MTSFPSVVKSPVGVGRQMPRDRFQKGHVHATGKLIKKWKGHYFTYEVSPDGKEKRIHRAVILGQKSQMKKWEAQQALAMIISETAAGAPKPSAEVTFEWFWENRYWPMHKAKLKPSSRYQLEWIVKKHLLPRFGKTPLAECTRFALQTFLNELAASNYGASLIHKVRTYLKAILDEAMEQHLLSSNPARKLDKPAVSGGEKAFLTSEQAMKLLNSLEGRDRLMLRLFLTCGFRPGELFALRWNDWEPGQLRIDEAVWQGCIGKPKTKGSAGSIFLPPLAEVELANYQKTSRNREPDSFIFSDSSRPANKRIWLEEILRPVADSLGIPLVTYQVMRRTFATLVQKCGTIKDAQAMLRHSSPSLTLGTYTQAIPESVKKAVRSLEQMISIPDPKGRPV